MRTIKFRGKRTDTEEWVFGNLLTTSNGYSFIDTNNELYEDGPYLFRDNTDMIRVAVSKVDEITVSQFTGLLDKNGKEIYEGDVIKVKMQDGDRIGRFYCKTNLPDHLNAKVKYDDSRCKFELMFEENTEGIISCEIGWGCEEFEVIGNIHDNPELLKGGKE